MDTFKLRSRYGGKQKKAAVQRPRSLKSSYDYEQKSDPICYSGWPFIHESHT